MEKMLLRSFSTPILGSLISSSSAMFSESPNNGFQLYHHSVERTTTASTSVHQGISRCCSQLPDSSERHLSAHMRRARSEGNIQDLLSICSDNSNHQSALKPSSAQGRDPVLETIPSFSIYSTMTVYEDEEENLQGEDHIDTKFSFSEHGAGEQRQRVPQPLFLARGLGIDRLPSGSLNLGSYGDTSIFGSDGNGNDENYSVKTDHAGDGYELEVYYKRALDDDPSNAIILRNYAQFLYQCKGDLAQAEEYYSRAILADPTDAYTISQYGTLIWKLHGDHERALSYMEHAANMNQTNCFVQAAYASFLWETGENEDREDNKQEFCGLTFHVGSLASASI
ncbi:hypothetical protein KSP39_PZI004263 [Platanthera zijinensis]|uniref:Uncharacterized protein n=1 Tax=Platanthera zijinensis TaxID=2320716 RepID=A0AAP0BTI6_9ASPA